MLVGFAAVLGICLVWTVTWDATESDATCTVSEMQRVLSRGGGSSSVWMVRTDECGILTIAYSGEGSGIAPSAVQPGSRYDFSLLGWEWLLYHRRIVAADRLG